MADARVGQQGTLTRVWAKRGCRPRAPRDTRNERACLFGAVCPGRGTAAGLVLPFVNTAAMTLHLAEISRTVAPGAHAVLVLDGAGWHSSKSLVVPDNISLLSLPPYSPELNPVENVWQFLRANWLAISVFDDYPAIVDACCLAWNRFADDPEAVTSITDRKWAQVNASGRWYHGSFFECLLCRRVGSGVFRARRKAAKTVLGQMLANRAFMQIHAELRLDTGLQTAAAPTHDAVPGRVGAFLDPSHEPSLLLGRQAGSGPATSPVRKARDPLRVVAMHPVPERLPIHPAVLGRRLAGRVFKHERNGEQPPHNPAVPGTTRLMTQLLCRQIASRDFHSPSHSCLLCSCLNRVRDPEIWESQTRVRSTGDWYDSRCVVFA